MPMPVCSGAMAMEVLLGGGGGGIVETGRWLGAEPTAEPPNAGPHCPDRPETQPLVVRGSPDCQAPQDVETNYSTVTTTVSTAWTRFLQVRRRRSAQGGEADAGHGRAGRR